MIDDLYKDVLIPKIKNDKKEYIYGEILPSSIDKIFNHLNLRNKNFLDIGSGLGKIVIQLAYHYPINISCGVEVCRKRHIVADNIKKKLDTQTQNKIFFVNKDIENFDIKNYNLILFSNICFSDDQNTRIGKILYSNSCILICLKRIDILDKYLRYYITNIETTWSDNINVYYYFINCNFSNV